MVHRQPPPDFNPKYKVSSCFLGVGNKHLYLQYQPVKFNGSWGIPAGKIESSETPASAMARELAEEAGIVCSAESFSNPQTMYVRYPDFDFTFHIFRYELSVLPQVIIDLQEHQAFKWLSAADALQIDLIKDSAACIHAAFPFTPPYWTNHLKDQAKRAKSFQELSPVALTILETMPQPIGQVCGPISNGGKGTMADIIKNTRKFSLAISNLINQGCSIFDQVPFQDSCLSIAGNNWTPAINQQLLDDFYLPIFESGLVQTLYFIPGWQSSAGATWEHAQAQRLGIDIVYLTEDLSFPEAEQKQTVHP